MTTVLAAIALLLAAAPAFLYLSNLRLYRRPPAPRTSGSQPRISVLVPARDEEANIGDALEAALASRGVELEVLVGDDGSTDRTAAIVREIAARDPRVGLLTIPHLPAGWNGKMHACSVLAQEATGELLVFVDADVRLEPDGLARMAAFVERSGSDLASGVPREVTETFLESLVVPLIHFVLLSFLPLGRMRRSRHPAYAAGTGQLVVVRRDAYLAAGGHAAIRSSRHDGVHLPRAFRRAGLVADLFDATDVASCRMYRSGAEVWRGFAKNADQGLGHPRAILPVTLALLGGQVAPLVILLAAGPNAAASALAALALGLSLLSRLAGVIRFRQPPESALLHPVGVAFLLANQWAGLVGRLAGRPTPWKGRVDVNDVPARAEPS